MRSEGNNNMLVNIGFYQDPPNCRDQIGSKNKKGNLKQE